MKKINRIFPVLCAVVLVSACNVDSVPPSPGEQCDVPEGQILKILEGTSPLPPDVVNLTQSDREWLAQGLCIQNYPICIHGQNETYCRKACTDGQILCNAECIDPKINASFCGAKGACNSEDPQNEDFRGMQCVNATCEDSKCVCITGFEEQDGECIKLAENNTAGSCGEEAVNCVTVFANFYSDALECREGECAIAEEYKESGGCISGYRREGNSCLQNNTVEHCGDGNIHCSKDDFQNSQEVQCVADSKGQNYSCIITSCISGYHVFDGVCEADNDENCGVHGVSCADDQPQNSTSVTCQSGLCKLTECAADFHVHGNICEPDDDDNCGEYEKHCTTDAVTGSTSVMCKAGTCIATDCDSSYVLDNDTCIPNIITSCNGQNCMQVFEHFKPDALDCVSGQCVIKDSLDAGKKYCESFYHREENKCVYNNTLQHCGVNDEDCSPANITGSLKTECAAEGYCKIKYCNTEQYYLDESDNKCKLNNDNNCSSKGLKCTSNPNLGVASSECINGLCRAKTCLKEYHIYTLNGVNTCEPDNIYHCGAHENGCIGKVIDTGLGTLCTQTSCECKNKECSAKSCDGSTPCEGNQVSHFACNGSACVAQGCLPGNIKQTDSGLYAHERYVLYQGNCIVPNGYNRCGAQLQSCGTNPLNHGNCLSTGCSSNDKYCYDFNVEANCLVNYYCSNNTSPNFTCTSGEVIGPIND